MVLMDVTRSSQSPTIASNGRLFFPRKKTQLAV
jgi:hypothetical protein